jgi:hypothetical protein
VGRQSTDATPAHADCNGEGGCGEGGAGGIGGDVMTG